MTTDRSPVRRPVDAWRREHVEEEFFAPTVSAGHAEQARDSVLHAARIHAVDVERMLSTVSGLAGDAAHRLRLARAHALALADILADAIALDR